MLEALAIAISATLYRVPRGGPGEKGWRKWIDGFSGFGSFGGALIWAAFTGCAFGYLFDLHWHWWAGITVYLMLAEAPGWARYWPNNADGGSFWKLTLRGVPLLHPFMGLIYYGLYRIEDRLPNIPVWRGANFLSGWTAWAELASGLMTSLWLWSILTAVF